MDLEEEADEEEEEEKQEISRIIVPSQDNSRMVEGPERSDRLTA